VTRPTRAPHRASRGTPSLLAARRRAERLVALVAAAVALSFGAACAHRRAVATATTAAPPVNTPELPVVSDPRVADSLLEDVHAADSTIVVALRYATSDNFTGTRLPGYDANRAFLRRQAADALGRVQRRLAADGLTLKVWDAYRPVRATLAMVDWTRRVGREDLLRDGYIASRSRHNLGLAIDLTLADRATGRELEMGTPFDTFSPAAHTANATGAAAANRRRLQSVMESEGFTNYDQEWWHYSYELPDPVRFDVVIR
jgi:D-alanyl-D-alanine dipeptidase